MQETTFYSTGKLANVEGQCLLSRTNFQGFNLTIKRQDEKWDVNSTEEKGEILRFLISGCFHTNYQMKAFLKDFLSDL